MTKRNADEKKSRSQETIDLDDEAAKLLDEFVNARGGRGMKKFVLSKLVHWFAKQPGPVKDVILGWSHGELSKAYASFLRDLANEVESGLNVTLVIGTPPPPAGNSKRHSVASKG